MFAGVLAGANEERVLQLSNGVLALQAASVTRMNWLEFRILQFSSFCFLFSNNLATVFPKLLI